jgi:hypothetical protein
VGLPADRVRTVVLEEGDKLEPEVTSYRETRLTPARAFDKAAFLLRVRALRSGMRMGAPVVDEMRREARF